MGNKRGKWVATSAALGVLIVLALFLRANADGPHSRFLPDCYLSKYTGLYCAGCGNTRLTYSLLHGDLSGALQQNALTLVALPFLIWGAVRLWMGWMNPGRLRPLSGWRPLHTWLVVGAIFAFTVLRNVPAKPFSWLAPVPLNTSGPAATPEALLPDETPPAER